MVQVMVVVMVVVQVMMVVSSRKHGSLRLRGLRILGANRCASGRTLGGTEPEIRKSGNWCSCCSTLFPPTLLPPLHFPSRSQNHGCRLQSPWSWLHSGLCAYEAVQPLLDWL